MNKKITRIIAKVITTILSIITFLLMLLAAYNFFSIKILRKDYANIFGYTFFEVVSGSMTPEIEKWDLIVVKIDSEYEVGDIISYKSGDAFITHRIVEKNGDTYITKGDANNTIDNPINKDAIIGKVIKVHRNLAAWIKVFTTPRIMVGGTISILLLIYTITLFKKDEANKLKEVPKIGKEEAMEKIKNNSRLKMELCIFLILLIALIFLIPYTLSRFKTEARGDAVMEIAFFIANDEYTHQSITLTDMQPGDQYSYTFSVANFDDDDRAEVNLSYNVEVVSTTNLPLVYELYLTNSGDVPIASTDEITEDEDGTYFKTLKTSSRNFNYNNNYIDYYKLTVKFPIEFKNFKYQGVAENIEIRVNAKQKLSSDN